MKDEELVKKWQVVLDSKCLNGVLAGREAPFCRMLEEQFQYREVARKHGEWKGLKLVNNSENAHNLSKDPRNTSGYTGVSWSKNSKAWQSYITVERTKLTLGYFSDLILAAEAYDIAALRRDSENHVLNFPEKKEKYLKYIEEHGKEILKNVKPVCSIQSGHKYINYDGGKNRKGYWKVKINHNYSTYCKTFPYNEEGLQLAIQWRNATYERLHGHSFSD